MAVKFTKPEINIREKLNELDYDHVPYHKMPAGSVIQTVSETYNGRIGTASTAFVSTGYYVEISPKMNNSNIFISISTSGNNNNSVGHDLFITLYRIADDGYHHPTALNLGHATYGITGLRTNGAASGINNRLEVPVSMNYLDAAEDLKKIKYEIWFRSESSSTTVEMPMLVGMLTSITAMEIKQ